MKQKRASSTAEYMALFRSLESFRPSKDRLFEDRLAIGFLKPALQMAARLSRIPIIGRFVPRYIDKHWPGARSSGIARTRFIDDALKKELTNGVRQVVILGAGYDCRAYRIHGIERARVYEVDYPSTLTAKRERLQAMLGRLPRHVTFSEIDFNRQHLGDVLAATGFDKTGRSFFIWEGVTSYLTGHAVDSTLEFVGKAPSGSGIIFTYIHKGVLDDPESFEGMENVTHLLRKKDEPWTFGFYPHELPAYLETRGLELVEDLSAAEYRARYMRPGSWNLKGYEFHRIALASRTSPAHPGDPSPVGTR
ncbi:MAG: SAM-dependent methyltransferase [Syntrophobacteraceae bacterium]